MANRLTWILALLAVAVYGIVANDLVLGLDLKGGVTMRYELEPPEAVIETEQANVDEMIDATVDTLRERINTYGIKESAITRQGLNEIVIELPGSSKEEAETIKSVVSRVGHLEFRIVLFKRTGEDDDLRNNVVVATEEQRLKELLEDPAVVGKTPDLIDVAGLDVRLPDIVYRWTPYSDKILAARRGVDLATTERTVDELVADAPLAVADYELVRIETGSSRTFTGGDIQFANQTLDANSNPAVGITLSPARAAEFGDWTEPNVNKYMGIMLDGRLAQSPAAINERLEGQFVIKSGQLAGFTGAEIKDYLTVIKSGSLQMKPRLLFENTVGPSLGESAIQAGLYASIAGFLAIILFMMAYYRFNGVLAAVSLVVNMVLLTGILMFLGATLTLPGIAGLVLTLGMAVDANILVFERMREESDAAKSMGQAVKLGFEKALPTILDANVTTFVTAFILYKVGTGPVRGFSVILMLGILTSVFSVVVVSRLMYDAVVKSGRETIAMGRLLRPDTRIAFMDKTRIATRISVVAVLVSLVAFFAADRDKYGLDFLGGYKAQVRLTEAVTQAEVADAVVGTFPRAQIVSVLDDVSPSGSSTKYVVKIKATAEEGGAPDDQEALEARYARPLKAALGSLILADPITGLTLTEDEESATTTVTATLNFQEAVDPDVVGGRLGLVSDLETEAAGPTSVTVTGRLLGTGLDDQVVVQRLRAALFAGELLPPLNEPFLESTTIGSRVGTELRDSAIRAILLSFIAIVLYIRVRFREYRYGWAAIIALAHDVSITLGVVALMHFTGVVDVELDLAMIAAFLTIIGYSLNDTIVLFDRIRENLPRLKGKTFREVLDISINQTLARTLLTSATTLTALILIFAFNYGRQNVLEGFSFAMIVGVVVGTYSSIFVASPALMALPAGGRHGAGSSDVDAQGKGGGKAKSHKQTPAPA